MDSAPATSNTERYIRRGGPLLSLLVVAAFLLFEIHQADKSIKQTKRSTELSLPVYQASLRTVQIQAEYKKQQETKRQPFIPAPGVSVTLGSERIVLVRVGQSGGTTVAHTFPRLECKHLISPYKLRACLEKHQRKGSPLSNQLELELHVEKGKPPRDLGTYTTFMFSIRNPLTRAIASYSFLHNYNTGKIFARKEHHMENHFYRFCFPTLGHLLRSVEYMSHPEMAFTYHGKDQSEIPTELSLYCQQMAYAVVQGTNPLVDKINAHLHRNNQFYYDKTIQRFPEKEVVAVRMEHLWQDIKALDVAMGGQGNFDNAGEVAVGRVDRWKDEQVPTPRQWRDLCCILFQDIASYQEIVNRAVNLDHSDKLQTMQDVFDICGVSSREERKFEETGPASAFVVFSWRDWHESECTTTSWERSKIDLSLPPSPKLVPSS